MQRLCRPPAVRRRSRDDAARGRFPAHRRGADRACRATATASVRQPVPALRAARPRTRVATPGRPRPGRGRRPGGLRVDLALGGQLPAERGPVAPWLYTVARNAIVDRGRARNEPPAEPGDRPPTSPARPRWPSSRGSSYRLHLALETLPESERTVIQLAYWSGLSQSEIATFLDIPLGTVKTRTRSGLRRLADELEEELANERHPIFTNWSATKGRPRSSSACGASTTCWSRPDRRPSCPRACKRRRG